MTSSDTPCPPPTKLDALQANSLPAAEAEQLRSHVAGCDKCRAIMAFRPRPKASASAFPFLQPAKGPGEIGWLGNYRVLRKCEEGGMAFVFDAEDTDLGRHVALKVLKPSVT